MRDGFVDSRSTALLAREKGSIVDSSAREGRLVRFGSSHGVERARDVPERDAIVVRERLGIVRAGGWDAVGDADDAGRRSGAKCVGGGADVYANVRAFGVGDDGADDAGAGIAERGARGVVFGVERDVGVHVRAGLLSGSSHARPGAGEVWFVFFFRKRGVGVRGGGVARRWGAVEAHDERGAVTGVGGDDGDDDDDAARGGIEAFVRDDGILECVTDGVGRVLPGELLSVRGAGISSGGERVVANRTAGVRRMSTRDGVRGVVLVLVV